MKKIDCALYSNIPYGEVNNWCIASLGIFTVLIWPKRIKRFAYALSKKADDICDLRIYCKLWKRECVKMCQLFLLDIKNIQTFFLKNKIEFPFFNYEFFKLFLITSTFGGKSTSLQWNIKERQSSHKKREPQRDYL